MFVYLLTGIWYEPGSKVFKLLETFECRWIDVLPRLLSESPADRPTNLKALAASLRRDVVAVPEKAEGRDVPPVGTRKRGFVFVLIGAAVLVAAAVGFFVFSRRSAPKATNDFDAAFGVHGIYRGGKP